VFVNVRIFAFDCLINFLSLSLYALNIFVTITLLLMTNCLSFQCLCFSACPKSPYMCLGCYSLSVVFLFLSLSSCLFQSIYCIMYPVLLLSVSGFLVLVLFFLSVSKSPYRYPVCVVVGCFPVFVPVSCLFQRLPIYSMYEYLYPVCYSLAVFFLS
jgi:hypothetical protein